MDLGALTPRLSDGDAGAILIDARLLRRVMKRHLRLSGLGLSVPHARSYVLSRRALLSIVTKEELGRPEESIPAEVILLPRPAPEDIKGATLAEARCELWRSTFHALIHLTIQRRVEARSLTPAMIRERIHRVGQTEFDEIRLVLRHDDLLLPPYDARESYAEFAALYLELRSFAPALLERVFPTLDDRGRIDAALAQDFDTAALLEACRPEGVSESLLPIHGSEARERGDAARPDEGAWIGERGGAGEEERELHQPIHRSIPAPRSSTRGVALEPADELPTADAAEARGNFVRAALLRLREGALAKPGQREAARRLAELYLTSLAERLSKALAPPGAHASSGIEPEKWAPILFALAESSGPRRGLRNTVPARLLYDLQRAAVAHERPLRAALLAPWILSLGGGPLVRELSATTPVRVARYVKHAAEKLSAVRMATPEKAALGELVREACSRAEENIRLALRPAIKGALLDVGLRPENAPERVALDKVTEELLDHVVSHGFIGVGHLRDAISRNQLKLRSLSGAGELLKGDALLKADRRMKSELAGVYRGGEIYLRALQKVSSVAFGTGPGRFLTRYVFLPFGASFVLLEGLSHIVSPLSRRLGHGHVRLLNVPSFLITAAVIFALLHSGKVRASAKRALSAVGWVLLSVFYRFPRWVLRLPFVRRIVESGAVFLVGRWVLKPAVVAMAITFATPLRSLPLVPRLGAGAAILAFVSALWNSRLGLLGEELLLDWIARQWTILHRRILPGLFRLVSDTFRALLELFERGIYRVDELFRFRQGERTAALAVKAVLGGAWFFVAYLFRVYINLLIEPQVNPIKHFPVVTVSHKIMIPFFPVLVAALKAPLRPLGPVAANTIAGTTVLLLPGVFGFLVWELKENFRLYRESRAEHLSPVLIGHHGETMGALMKPGFHSGTLPKLYAKLRRAAAREPQAVARHEEALHEVGCAVERFAERELAALLAEAPLFRAGQVLVRGARLSSNRVRVELVCPALSPAPCVIAFEEQSGAILASVPSLGWVAELSEVERVIVENALAGLYKLAGVDLVREQIEAALCQAFQVATAPPYDIATEGLLVWPREAAEAYGTEIVIPLVPGRWRSSATGDGAPLGAPLDVDVDALLYRRRPIRWADWVAAWALASEGDAPVPRLTEGAPILPRAETTEMAPVGDPPIER